MATDQQLSREQVWAGPRPPCLLLPPALARLRPGVWTPFVKGRLPVRSGDPRRRRRLCAEEAAGPGRGRGRGWGRRCGGRAVRLHTHRACRANTRGPRRCSQERGAAMADSGHQASVTRVCHSARPRWPAGCRSHTQAASAQGLCSGPAVLKARPCAVRITVPGPVSEAVLQAFRGLLQYLCPECSSPRNPGRLPFLPSFTPLSEADPDAAWVVR